MALASIRLQFAVLLCCFAAVFLGSVALFHTTIRDLQSRIGEMAEVVQPRSAAGFEMEINMVETGLGVAEYLIRPTPQYRRRFEDDQGDFRRFADQFRALAETREQVRSSDAVDRTYADFSRIGNELMDQADALWQDRQHLSDAMRALAAFLLGSTEPAQAERARNPEQAALADRLLAATGQMISLLVADGSGTSGTGPHPIDTAAQRARALLAEYSARSSLPADKAWARESLRLFDHLNALVARVYESAHKIDDRFTEFVALRTQLDDMLDEEIQIHDAEELKSLQARASRTLSRGDRTVAAAAVLGIVLSLLGVVYVSRRIVRPLHRLTAAAEHFSAGDLQHRVAYSGRSELGRLASAFNRMAEQREIAYGRLNETNAQLDAEVADRTRELGAANQELRTELERRRQMELELRDATVAAQAANNAKTLFLANMSHELRTPLHAIIGFSDMMQHQLLAPVGNPRYERYIADIGESASLLLKLLNDVLDVARIELGKVDIAEERVDLPEIAAGAIRLLTAQADSRDIRVELEQSGNVSTIRGDSTRIRQILLNLIGNAIKFTPDRGKVRVTFGSSDNGGAVISVIDTGIGIAPEDMPKALDLFSQVPGRCRAPMKGPGWACKRTIPKVGTGSSHRTGFGCRVGAGWVGRMAQHEPGRKRLEKEALDQIAGRSESTDTKTDAPRSSGWLVVTGIVLWSAVVALAGCIGWLALTKGA